MKRLILVLLGCALLLPLLAHVSPVARLGKYNVRSIKTLTGDVEAVELYQNLLLIGNGSILEAYSVENPDSPEWINSIVVGYDIFDIRILQLYYGDTESLVALIFCGYYGVYIINVTLTTQMSIIAEIPVEGLSVDAVRFQGNRLIVSNGSLVEINTISWSYSMVEIEAGSVNITVSNIRYLATRNQYLYAGLDNGSMIVLSSGVNPNDPFTFERIITMSDTALDELLVNGDRLYVASRGEGVYVFDISIPVLPRPVSGGHADTRGYSHRLYIYSHYLYVADGGEGLTVLDISSFNYLKSVGYHDTEFYMRDLAVKDYRVYAANSEGGLCVYLHESSEIQGIIIDWTMVGWLASVAVVGGVSFWLSRRREE